jgi:hypothetical protein
MYDGRAGKQITASMFMLPERSLAQFGNQYADSWFCTLVDARWYWYWSRGNIYSPSSWANLFEQIGSILGVTIQDVSVDSRYGVPSSKWELSYGPPSVILDAAANQIGQKIVVDLDGTVRLVKWSTARTAADIYVTDGPAIISGGLTSEAGIARYVPESVKVLFLDTSTFPPPTTPIVGTRPLTSLAIPEYGASTGVTGYHQSLNADIPYDGSNGTAISNYADVAATDWYGWRLPDLDIVYPGIEPWVPTGWEDIIEWTIQVRGENGEEPFASTLVRRGPWSDFQSGTWYRPCTPFCVPESGSGSGSGGDCEYPIETVEVSCADGVRTLTSKFIDLANQDGRLIIKECSTQEYNLGPCSPVTPDGVTIPVVSMVCPIYDTIHYLDWESAPQSKQVVVGIKIERKLITVPIAEDVLLCYYPKEDDCCGSGSGSGQICGPDECFTSCSPCQDPGMSTQWEFTDYYTGLPVLLCHIDSPNDGNNCRFLSEDGNWTMYYDTVDSVWILQSYITGDIWFKASTGIGAFGCNSANSFSSISGPSVGSIEVTPIFTCEDTSWNCVDSVCVEVAGTGGTYPTQQACLDSGCAVPGTPACSCASVPLVLYAHFTGALAPWGSVALAWIVGSRWEGTDPGGCGVNIGPIIFECNGDNHTWHFTNGGPSTFFNLDLISATSCAPFSWTGSGTAIGTCFGAFTVVINSTP